MRQAVTIGCMLLGIMLYGVVFIDDESSSRRADELRNQHRTVPQPRHDEVVASLPDNVKRDNEIELNFTAGSGDAFRAYVDRQEANIFLKSTLAYIDERRAAAQEQLQVRIDEVFVRAFADRKAAVDRYADWFYGYFTSFDLLGRGAWRMMGELFSMNMEQIQAAPVQAVEDEMRARYLEFVLKPAIRDPEIVAGVQAALEASHRDYLQMLGNIDQRVVGFIAEHARYVEAVKADSDFRLKLDWEAESWRAPLQHSDDALHLGLAGLTVIAGGVLAGDTIMAGFASVFGPVLVEAAMGAEAVGTGATLGSIEPGVGTAIGAAAGLTLHGVMSFFREKMGRDEFEAQTDAALDTSIARWKRVITPKARDYIARWFEDTARVIATPNLEAKLGS